MDEWLKLGRRRRSRGGLSDKGSCPADRQAASWWSHLTTQSQSEMIRASFTYAMYCSPFFPSFFLSLSQKGRWDWWQAAEAPSKESEAVCVCVCVAPLSKTNTGASSGARADAAFPLVCCSYVLSFLTPLLPSLLFILFFSPCRTVSLLALLYVCGWEPANLKGKAGLGISS